MSLTIDHVCVKLQKSDILKEVSLEIRTGEFVSLLGASGCGKTTLLKSIAGLLEVESGDMRIDGSSILQTAPEKRGTVIVFQDLRLFPHMTVEKNIAFSMELQKVPKEERRKRTAELLEAVQLPGFEKRKIREMSGGQRQRVALARALAADPKILLLDEPFSSLDENLRDEIGKLVKKLHTEMGLTTIMVTHDKAEAMKFSDRIALMKSGEILQYDEPEVLFRKPASRAVAEYMGQTNYIRGTVKEGRFHSGISTMETDESDGVYDLMLRPSEMGLCRLTEWTNGNKVYTIKEVLYEGETAEITVVSETESFLIWMLHGEWEALGLRKGDVAGIYAKARNGILFPVEAI
jgi:ABC-type Fe3+/spermidine/putrescine transport system ATPase subunit